MLGVITKGKHLCECWGSTPLQGECKTWGRAPGHGETENHAFFSGGESGICFHGIANHCNTWLPSHNWFWCHFPVDVFLWLLLTSFLQSPATECFHHLLKLQACVSDLLSEFSRPRTYPAWVLFTEWECDWIVDMVLCFLIESRMLNYFSNHLLST